jgi:copper(I)-binding protein
VDGWFDGYLEIRMFSPRLLRSSLSVTSTKLDEPYDHGKPVTEDVSEISSAAGSMDNWLPDTDQHTTFDISILSSHRKNTMKLPALSLALALLCGVAHAQNVEIKDAWIRTSVPGQKSTGAFMKITAKENMKLVSASTPVAGVAEVHEMKMEGDVMKMRAVNGGLDLPAGKTVELSPGGYHLMMMDLKNALPKDSTVPLTLVFKDAKGVESTVELKVPVALSMDASLHKH